MTRVSALALSAADFNTHSLHAADRIWPQKNCYVDLWIALLHAQNLDPLAMLPMVFALEFEGDQWTFFKPPLGDLRLLYGIDVQELTLWQSLLSHALEHLGAGKLLSVEVDSWWLPDTAGTDYRSAHAKTTIVVNDIDVAARRLGYFHNDGYHLLDGEDFAQLFCLDGALPVLPPYAELIRIDRAFRRDAVELRDVSRGLLAEHLTWRPRTTPSSDFGIASRLTCPACRRRAWIITINGPSPVSGSWAQRRSLPPPIWTGFGRTRPRKARSRPSGRSPVRPRPSC